MRRVAMLVALVAAVLVIGGCESGADKSVMMTKCEMCGQEVMTADTLVTCAGCDHELAAGAMMMKCPKCGGTRAVADMMKKCAKCGKMVLTADAMKCKCGAALTGKDMLCAKCAKP